MAHRILLTADAATDLEEIWDYITRSDSIRAADGVLDRVEAAFQRLAQFPTRGNRPRELLSAGDREYREVFFKPYRIIYRVEGGTVVVYVISDGRRDMQSLLTRRLLGP